MAFRSFTPSSPAGGSSVASISCAVPAGAAIGDIAVFAVYLETTATVTASGFTSKSDLATGTPASVGRLVVFWKRLTAVDAGSYTATWTGAAWAEASCALFSGRATTGDPFESVSTNETTGSGTCTAAALTPLIAGDDLVGFASNFAGGAWTPPSGMTERQDASNADITLDTADNVVAGTTGTKSFVCAGGSAGMKAFLGALLPAVPISFVRGNFQNDGATSESSIVSTFPSNDAGNLLVVTVGYLDTAGTGSVTSITDTAGNTWKQAGTKVRNATQQYALQTFYAWRCAASAGTNTVTATLSTAETFVHLHLQEYHSVTGPWTSDPIDKTSSGTGNGTAMTATSATPTANNELIYSVGASGSGNVSAATGLVIREPGAANASTGSADQIQATAAATTGPLTASATGQWALQLTTFFNAAAPGSPRSIGNNVRQMAIQRAATW